MTNFELENCDSSVSSSDGGGHEQGAKAKANTVISGDIGQSPSPDQPSSSSGPGDGDLGFGNSTANEPKSSASTSLYEIIPLGPPLPPTITSTSSVPGYGGNSSYLSGNHGDLFGGGGGAGSSTSSSWINTNSPTSSSTLRPAGDMGLTNIGNTCFMNSGLQCLIHTASLAEYFLRPGFDLKSKEEFNLTREFQTIIKLAWQGICSSFSLTEFRNKLGDIHSQFKDGRQHDCQEFLALMLDTLHEQLKKIEATNLSPISVRPFVRLNGLMKPQQLQSMPVTENDSSSSSAGGIIPFKVRNPNQSPKNIAHKNGIVKVKKSDLKLGPTSSTSTSHTQKCKPDTLSLSRKTSTAIGNSTNKKPGSGGGGYSSRFFSYATKPSNSGSLVENGIHHRLWQHSKATKQNGAIGSKKVEDDTVKAQSAKRLKLDLDLVDSAMSEGGSGDEAHAQGSPSSSSTTTLSEVDSGIGIQHKEEGSLCSSSLHSPSFDVDSNSLHSAASSPREQPDEEGVENARLNVVSIQTETERAEEYWAKHIADNNTVICKSFQGLFKSTVICSECKFVSVTYEPFMYLSVPIPRITSRPIEVKFMSIKGDRRIHSVTVIVQHHDTVLKLKESVCNEIPGLVFDVLNSGDLVMAEVVNYNIARKLDDDTLLSYVNDQNRNIYMYELNDNFNEKYGQDSNNLLSLHGMTMFQGDQSYSNGRNSELNPTTYLDEDWDNTDLPPVPLIEMGECGPGENEADVNVDLLGQDDLLGSGPPSDIDLGVGNPSQNLDDLNGIDGMEIVSSSQEPGATETTDCLLSTSQFPTCLICLEQFPVSFLRKHKDCDAVICEACLKDAAKYFQDDKVKNTVNASNLSHLECPTCFQKADRLKDFHMFWSLPSCQLLGISILFRHQADSNNNSLTDPPNPTNLFGTPYLVRIPSCLPASELHQFIQLLNPFPELEYRLVILNSDATRCACCLMADQCDGCEIPTVGEVSIQPNTCLVISYTNISLDQVQDFNPLDMATASPSMLFSSSNYTRQEPPVDIHDCLRSFSEVEYLDEQNPWNCPKCKKRQCATKTMTICRLPDYLIIYLKRFVYENRESKKLNNRLNFPLTELDMSSYLDQDCLPRGQVQYYDLYSSVCHYGSPTSGHYTAFSKNPVTGAWHYFNDSSVEEKIPTQNSWDFSSAYILFFQRQGLATKIPRRNQANVYRPVSSVLPLTPSLISSVTASASNRPIAYTSPMRNWDKEQGGSVNSTFPDSSSSSSVDEIHLTATGVKGLKRESTSTSTCTSTAFDFTEDPDWTESKLENDENAIPQFTASVVTDSHNGYMELD